MIGRIGIQADIELYLEAEELEKLQNETIEGVLVKIQKPKRQGVVSVSINDARKSENGLGIGIDDSGYWGVQDNFRLQVFIGTEWYQKLRQRGAVGLRQSMMDGSTINVFDRSRLDHMDELYAEQLEFYRDNRDRLPESFG